MVQFNFNADEHQDEYPTLPAGTYEVAATGSKRHEKDNGEWAIIFQFGVLSGPHKGQDVGLFLCLGYRNDRARQAGLSQLKKLCEACGKRTIQQSEELHGIPIEIDVALTEVGGEMRSQVKKMRSLKQAEYSAPVPEPKESEETVDPESTPW